MCSCELVLEFSYTLASVVYLVLLYLLVSTRAVIGQFSGPYSPVAKLFSDLSQIVLNFIASKNLKLFFLL